MADHNPIPEPPDASLVLVGDPLGGVVLLRDDHTAREGGYFPPVHWFDLGDRIDPLSWPQVIGVEPDKGQLAGVDLSQITRLYTQDEVDDAVAAGGYEDIGDHRIALGPGRCVLHGEVYQPNELDLLRERNGGGSRG